MDFADVVDKLEAIRLILIDLVDLGKIIAISGGVMVGLYLWRLFQYGSRSGDGS